MRPTLLLTRPAAQARRFADAFAERFGADWPVVFAPLTEIVPLEPGADRDADGVILTSSNAAPYLSDGRNRTAFCVGPATARAARAAGFHAITGPGDGVGLAQLIRDSGFRGKLIHARGLHMSVDLAALLEGAPGLQTRSVAIYDQRAIPLAPEAEALIAGTAPLLAPLFSPRSARLFAAFSPRAPLWLLPISQAVARAWPLEYARISIAPQPNAAGILTAAAELVP